MRVLLTGATGFIGSAIIPELIKASHQVLGMTQGHSVLITGFQERAADRS